MLANVFCVFIGVAIGAVAAYKSFAKAEQGAIKFCKECPLISNVEVQES